VQRQQLTTALALPTAAAQGRQLSGCCRRRRWQEHAAAVGGISADGEKGSQFLQANHAKRKVSLKEHAAAAWGTGRSSASKQAFFSRR